MEGFKEFWDHYKGAIIVGPFLSSVPGTEFMSDIIAKNQIPISERKQLQEFYESLSVVNNSFTNSIGELLVNLSLNPFTDAQCITSDPIPSNHNKESIKTVIDESKSIIELRYKNEETLQFVHLQGFLRVIRSIRFELMTPSV